MWLIYLKIHQARLTKMQPPLHSSFGKNIVTQDGCAVLIIELWSLSRMLSTSGKTQSQIALSTPFTTFPPAPLLAASSPWSPGWQSGTQKEAQGEQIGHSAIVFKHVLEKMGSRSERRELKTWWHELQHLEGQRQRSCSRKGKQQRSSKMPFQLSVLDWE